MSTDHTHLQLNSKVLSRHHAVIRVSPDGRQVFCRDLGSTHGTFVFRNGQEHQVKPNHRFEMFNGDVISFGRDVFRRGVTFRAIMCRVAIIPRYELATWASVSPHRKSASSATQSPALQEPANRDSVPTANGQTDKSSSASGRFGLSYAELVGTETTLDRTAMAVNGANSIDLCDDTANAESGHAQQHTPASESLTDDDGLLPQQPSHFCDNYNGSSADEDVEQLSARMKTATPSCGPKETSQSIGNSPVGASTSTPTVAADSASSHVSPAFPSKESQTIKPDEAQATQVPQPRADDLSVADKNVQETSAMEAAEEDEKADVLELPVRDVPFDAAAPHDTAVVSHAEQLGAFDDVKWTTLYDEARDEDYASSGGDWERSEDSSASEVWDSERGEELGEEAELECSSGDEAQHNISTNLPIGNMPVFETEVDGLKHQYRSTKPDDGLEQQDEPSSKTDPEVSRLTGLDREEQDEHDHEMEYGESEDGHDPAVGERCASIYSEEFPSDLEYSEESDYDDYEDHDSEYEGEQHIWDYEEDEDNIDDHDDDDKMGEYSSDDDEVFASHAAALSELESGVKIDLLKPCDVQTLQTSDSTSGGDQDEAKEGNTCSLQTISTCRPAQAPVHLPSPRGCDAATLTETTSLAEKSAEHYWCATVAEVAQSHAAEVEGKSPPPSDGKAFAFDGPVASSDKTLKRTFDEMEPAVASSSEASAAKTDESESSEQKSHDFATPSKQQPCVLSSRRCWNSTPRLLASVRRCGSWSRRNNDTSQAVSFNLAASSKVEHETSRKRARLSRAGDIAAGAAAGAVVAFLGLAALGASQSV